MTETYALLPAIIAVFCAIQYGKTGKRLLLFLSGLMVSAAFLFKPTGAAVGAPIVLYLTMNYFCDKKRLSFLFLDYSLFALGVLLPIISFAAYFFAHNALKDAILQIFVYNIFYSSKYPLLFSVRKFIAHIFISAPLGQVSLLIILGMVGVFYGFLEITENIRKKRLGPNPPGRILFLLLFFWLLADMYAVSFSGKCYSHYDIQLIPSLALLSGYTVSYFSTQFKSNLRLFCFMCIFFLLSSPVSLKNMHNYRASQKEPLNDSNSISVKGIRYKHERAPLVRWITQNSSENDYVYFWGAEAELNFLANRRNPGKYIYLYPLQTLKYAKKEYIESMISDFKRNKPKFIVDTGSTPDNAIPTLNKEHLGESNSPYENQLLLPAIRFINEEYIYKTTINQWDVYERRKSGKA